MAFRAQNEPTNYYVHLFTSSAIITADTDTFGDLSNEASGGGYGEATLVRGTTKFDALSEDNGNAATATVTITNYPQLNIGDKVTLKAAPAPTVGIDFTVATDGSGWDPGSSNNAAATALATLVNANANFSASADSAVVTITQSASGAAGNTAITLADTGTAGMSKTDFTGGGGNGRGEVQLVDVSWTASGGSIVARYAVLTDDAGGSGGHADNNVIAYWDLGSDKTAGSGGVFTLSNFAIRINES